MNNKYCPECGAILVEDYDDIIIEDEHGGYTIHDFEVWKCRKQCGFKVKKQ
ncbi:hypothetical protein JOC54_003083 [Alkalihalobacillus xiaoxiensis]|uniref:Uncharacterized protein n=1 Tax=Shouchella xiaoxiensis TaxID=766895 RepID=A0ABS2SWC2_9BACI|nr:hypothetical protein [Shouchella xiaoxiensis]MBM7839803.1 hypothetical protein [Shouchella xiaoxiensis]